MSGASASRTPRKERPRRGAVLIWGPLKPPTTARWRKVGLVDDTGRYFSQSTGLTLVDLINPEITEQRTGLASAGVNFNAFRYRSPIACLIVSRQYALAGTGQVSLPRRRVYCHPIYASPSRSRDRVPDRFACPDGCCLQRLVQVIDQIFHRLQTDRQANEVGCDSCLVLLIRRQL